MNTKPINPADQSTGKALLEKGGSIRVNIKISNAWCRNHLIYQFYRIGKWDGMESGI